MAGCVIKVNFAVFESEKQSRQGFNLPVSYLQTCGICRRQFLMRGGNRLAAIYHEPTKKMQIRSNLVVLVIMLLVAAAVVVRLFILSVMDHKFYAEMANSTHFKNIPISANRGTIYDANGTPLAWSATVYKVYIDPTLYREEMEKIDKIMKQRQEIVNSGGTLEEGKKIIRVEDLEADIVRFLSEKLGVTPDTVKKAMVMNTKYYVLKNQVEKNVADELAEYFSEYGINSITTQEDTKRYYPQNELAAQVIGFTNGDGVGQYGLEAYYNKYLSGTNGRVVSASDGMGNAMPYRFETTYPAQDGSSLYLTIDNTLQYYLEKNLQKMWETYQVRNRTCGIIMNAKTGAIYAMGTYPSFDLNNPSEIYDANVAAQIAALPEEEQHDAYISAREKQWKNKAITELYVPGSVFKIFTTSIAIEENVLNPATDMFNCKGVVEVADWPIKCHKTSGHGLQTFSKALTNSCNPAFIEVGQRIGSLRFSAYSRAFGLTERTGIDLPSEAKSVYMPEEKMGIVELSSSAFGQTNKLTPIEMITGIAAAVNGGNLVQPHVVSKIVSSDGNVIETMETKVKRQVISEETSSTVRRLLQAVVDDNGGGNANIKGYAIGGKSGTSQKLDEYDNDHMEYVSSYACFAPADDPEIIMLLLADEPDQKIGYYGSVVCAPYARSILEEALPYLGYYPEYTDEEYAQLDVTVPLLIDVDVTTAKTTLEAMGLQCEIMGEGTNIVKQCPLTGSKVSPNGKVILYTDSNYATKYVEVPDLRQFTAKTANEALTNRGLNYVSAGASADRNDVLVQRQSVEPGTKVEIGTVIELTYMVNDQSG